MIRWISALDETPAWPAPCAWVVRRDSGPASFAATPTPEDLADAAPEHTRGGRSSDAGAGRLWRRRLLRALTARWLGAAPDEIGFRRQTSGAVRLLAPRPGFVSAASRGDWAAVGVAADLIGVDIELTGGERRLPLTPPEADLGRWTATEAYAKATGCSLDEAWAAAARSDRIAAPGRPELSVSHLETAEFLAGAAWR
jgi:phosphopantetheinyl transferase